MPTRKKGVNFVTISERIGNNPGDLGLILFNDEAHYHLSGHVNKQNMKFWASQQPYKHTHRLLSQEKVTLRCAISKGGIFRPYFFEDNDGNCVTVNIEQYIKMMPRKFVCALRRKKDIHMDTMVFQQDGAPPHYSNRTLEYLRQCFPGDKLISPWTNNPWPHYSPDLNPLTIFCGGTWKTEFMKTLQRQQRVSKTTSEEKSHRFHKNTQYSCGQF